MGFVHIPLNGPSNGRSNEQPLPPTPEAPGPSSRVEQQQQLQIDSSTSGYEDQEDGLVQQPQQRGQGPKPQLGLGANRGHPQQQRGRGPQPQLGNAGNQGLPNGNNNFNGQAEVNDDLGRRVREVSIYNFLQKLHQKWK